MRFRSLDVARGLTIAAMILVNNQGSGAHAFPGMSHAKWHGLSPADLVFPCFLFVMGASMAFSFARQSESGIPRRAQHLKVVRRATLLVVLGVALNALPRFDPHDVRYLGVLQRIGLAYLLSSLVVLDLSPRWRWGVGAAVLLGYWAALVLIPVPGHGPGILTPDGNLAGWIDRTLFGVRHVYKNGPYDPEGLLATLPATVTVLLGFAAGDRLRTRPVGSHTTRTLVLWGVAAALAGLAWHPAFPINKRLWTSPYVLVSAGIAMVLVAAIYELVEVRGWRAIGWPFEVFGVNAIFVYLASEEVAGLLTTGGSKAWLYAHVFEPLAGPVGGSLAFALAFAAVWWLVLVAMWRQRWFVKI